MRGCDQCQVLSINGIACHESGCPNSHIDPATGKPYLFTCRICDEKFRLKFMGQKVCGRCERIKF